MGCDIHLIAERRTRDHWEVVRPPVIACWRCKPESVSPTCYWCKGIGAHRSRWYSDRNYAVFTILAGVRQRDDVTGIDEPRGLPADLSPLGRRLLTVDCDHHSESWLTLDEVFAYDWTQTINNGMDPPFALASPCSAFLTRMRLLHATASRPASDVRIVFNFDN